MNETLLFRDRDRGRLPASLALCVISLTVVVALPWTLYSSNAGDFSLAGGQLLLITVPLFLLAMLAALVIVWCTPILQWPRVGAFLCALAVLFWLQAHVIVWQYGPLDGRTIDWNQFRVNGYVDGALWLVVIGMALWQPRRTLRLAMPVCALLIVMQSVAIAYGAVYSQATEIRAGVKRYEIAQSGKFDFSGGRNVLLVVLDEAQGDVFTDLLVTEPSYRDIFAGFVHYDDAIAGSNFTELAVPALLTGHLYDNSRPRSEYLREAFLGDSLPARLKRGGFVVELYPWIGWANESIYFDETIADNLRPTAQAGGSHNRVLSERSVKEVIHLLDLSLFRSVPHIVKPLIYNNQRWFLMPLISSLTPSRMKNVVSADSPFETDEFAAAAEKSARVVGELDMFKYYHLKGVHGPLKVREDLESGPVPVPFTRGNYVLQYEASLHALARFLRKLKSLGIYDESLIVIAGDHGSGYSEELFVRRDSRDGLSADQAAPATRRNFQKDKARALALLLIKPIGSSGTMVTVDTPVSHLQLPEIILQKLGLNDDSRDSLAVLSHGSHSIVRHFAAFDYRENKREYVGPITLYQVSGPGRRDASWRVSALQVPP